MQLKQRPHPKQYWSSRDQAGALGLLYYRHSDICWLGIQHGDQGQTESARSTGCHLADWHGLQCLRCLFHHMGTATTHRSHSLTCAAVSRDLCHCVFSTKSAVNIPKIAQQVKTFHKHVVCMVHVAIFCDLRDFFWHMIGYGCTTPRKHSIPPYPLMFSANSLGSPPTGCGGLSLKTEESSVRRVLKFSRKSI